MRTRIKSYNTHRLLEMMLTVLMSLVLILGMSTPFAWADTASNGTETVSYVDADGTTHTVTANVVNEGDYSYIDWNSGWYLIRGRVNIIMSLDVEGDVNVILEDGAELLSHGYDANPGICCGGGSSLTIYGQSAQSGEAYFQGGKNAPGIGNYDGNDTGTGKITINGGIIKAYGGTSGAGIGGGARTDGSNIHINGGTVTARGGKYAAGIGGGRLGSCRNVTITGGTVKAIGGKDDNGGSGYAAIGAGKGGSSNDVTVSGNMIVKAGNVSASDVITFDVNTDLSTVSAFNQKYVSIEKSSFVNSDSDEDNIGKASIKSLTSGNKKLTVRATTSPASEGGTYYSIAYKAKGSSNWKYTTTTTSSKTIKNLESGKRYYVKMRVCKKTDDSKNYGGWSATKLSKAIK